MVAVLPLPGSPLYDGNDQRVMDQALADLEAYKNAGVDSIMFENDHDLPYIQPPLDGNGVALGANCGTLISPLGSPSVPRARRLRQSFLQPGRGVSTVKQIDIVGNRSEGEISCLETAWVWRR